MSIGILSARSTIVWSRFDVGLPGILTVRWDLLMSPIHRHALGLLALLLPFTDYDEPREWTGTAMYYAGLCYHCLGREKKAKALWRRHRSELPFDRMARRSAGSLGLEESEAFLNQELLERKGWW